MRYTTDTGYPFDTDNRAYRRFVGLLGEHFDVVGWDNADTGRPTLTTLIDNACDFAKSEVLIRARFDDAAIVVEIRDDGPGFAPDVLAKLGQPYVTSRPQGENSRTKHEGMGLGFFIAKVLLEQTGGVVKAVNPASGGARVSINWARGVIDGQEPPATALD